MQLNCDIKKRGKIIANAKRVPYELEDNILTFEWEDMKHCLDLENMEFTRENDDYSFFLNIKEQQQNKITSNYHTESSQNPRTKFTPLPCKE